MKDTESRCKELEAKVAELQGRLDNEIIGNLLDLKSTHFPLRLSLDSKDLASEQKPDHPPAPVSDCNHSNLSSPLASVRSELDIIFKKLREKRHWSDRRSEQDYVGEVIPISDQVAGSGPEPSSQPRLTPWQVRKLLEGGSESPAVEVAGGARRTPEGSYRRSIRMDGPGSGYLTYAQVVDSYEDKILSALEYLEFLSSLPSEESSNGGGGRGTVSQDADSPVGISGSGRRPHVVEILLEFARWMED